MTYHDKRLIGGSGDINNLMPAKYQWSWEMVMKSIANVWFHHQTPMDRDKPHFDTVLSPVEKDTFLNVFATLTTSDIVVLRNVAAAVLRHITAPEVELYLTRQIGEEGVHTITYQHVIEVLCLDEASIYSRYLTIPEIKQKFDYAKIMSDKIDRFDDLDSFLEGLFFYYMVFEGIWFYNGFSPIYSLGRRNILPGTTTQLQYIQRDECVSSDTELLTPNGWINVKDVSYNTWIAQWHDDGTLSFTQPVTLSKHYADHGYRFYSSSGKIDQLVSENHRMVYYTERGNLKVVEAHAATPNPYCKFIATGRIRSDRSTSLTPIERLKIVVQADGNIKQRSTISDTIIVRLKKHEKIIRLTEILNYCNITYTCGFIENRQQTSFRWLSELGIYDKEFSWIDLSKVDCYWCQDFIQEVLLWDGHIRSETNGIYCSTNKQAIDKVQAIASMAGYRTNIYESEDDRKDSYKTYYRLSIMIDNCYVTGGCIVKERVPYGDFFYGFQVPSSYLLIRRNGAVSITGNSNHVAFGVKLLKGIFDENKRLSQDSAHSIMAEGIRLEEVYAKRTIGTILGYNPSMHIEQAKYIANRRLKQLGYDILYPDAENVLPWLDEMVNTNKEKNFFETHVTEYQSAASLDGTW